MKVRQMYCSGCDRDVPVLAEDPLDHEAQANVHDPQLVCLEIGDWCTGQLCPLGAAEPSAMVARLVRSGESLEGLTLVAAWCPVCERRTELALYGGDRAACTECGRNVPRPASGSPGPGRSASLPH
jgi:hypothetical protein